MTNFQMKKSFITGFIFFLCFNALFLRAQHWHYHNPTLWFDINSIELLGPGTVAIGGGREANDSIQVMFQSEDYGLSWYENAHDGLAPWNKSMAFSDSLNGIAVGYEGRIIKSGDAGRNWGFNVYPVNRDLNKIVYSGAGTFYVAGGNKTHDSIQTILKSSDYGNSWNVIYDVPGPWLKSIAFINSLKGFAVGDQGVILTTTNGGTSWTSVASPVQRDFNAITFISSDTGYIVGGTASGLFSRATILITVNGGSDWNVLTDQQRGIFNDISFADASVGYIVGDRATVLQTTDGGRNWMPVVVDTTLTGNECFNVVKFYNRNFGAIGGKGGKLYIYINTPVEAYTIGVNNIGTTDATLLGGINTHTKNARYSFVYSDNIQFNSPDTTQGIHVRNDSLLMISEHIQGLSPNTTYYYFLKAVTPSGIISGDTLSFYTGTIPSFVFRTLDATTVGYMAANLNGFIDKATVPVQLSFEYGITPAFGYQVATNPAIMNDTLAHHVQTGITGLQANTRYFFRLKGISSYGTFYGDTKAFDAISLPNVGTGMASNVTLTGAQLNGIVTNYGAPYALKFDYGESVLYGNEVNAIPDSVTGPVNVFPVAVLNGLSPRKTYHYRLKAINSDGTSYGEDLTFITGGPVVYSAPATNITLHTAQLNASVNAFSIPTSVKFEYGLTNLYGNEANAVPDSVTGSIYNNVIYQLSGLTQGETYHFRVKASNRLGIVYGNDMMFTTNSPPSVHTLLAREIRQNSAQLNGNADAGGIPAAIKFEYGTTTSYGNEIDAIPDSLFSEGIVPVYATVSGLMPNKTYHFRIKGTNHTTTNYGNDMLFYSGYPEIPNFDFENWTPITYAKPEGWNLTDGIISQYSPACHNNYAVKIQNDTLNNGQPGAILDASTLDRGRTFLGGSPFHARPDTLKGCFNYYIANNDTALILLILKKQGVVISYNWFPITGSSSGNYTNLSFPIPYTSPGIADSIIIGFIATNLKNIPGPFPADNYLIIDNIRFSGTTENIPNNDFERWEENTHYYLNDWFYGNKYVINPVYPFDDPVSLTTDAQHGDYAALLQTFMHPSDTMSSGISTGTQWDAPGFRVNARHQSLNGYYKFSPENNDSMNVYVNMYKNHANIGNGSFQSAIPVSVYTPFTIDIFYNDTITPDSCRISISQWIKKPKGNSKLYIDNLNFDGFISEIKQTGNSDTDLSDFKVYPNPFSDMANATFTINHDEYITIRLFDISGKKVALLADGMYKAGNNIIRFSAEGLQKGFYFCVISTKNQVFTKKIIIY